jgi:hypothetical protein
MVGPRSIRSTWGSGIINEEAAARELNGGVGRPEVEEAAWEKDWEWSAPRAWTEDGEEGASASRSLG